MDEADYRLYMTNTDMFPGATAVLHTFHDWFYYLLLATNVLTIVWYCKLIWTRVSYSKVIQNWG